MNDTKSNAVTISWRWIPFNFSFSALNPLDDYEKEKDAGDLQSVKLVRNIMYTRSRRRPDTTLLLIFSEV